MNDYIPSYAEYEKILRAAKQTGKLTDYWQAKKQNKFIVLRHDVEFSIKKAVEMAEIEHQCGIQASYFFQIGNNAYNIFSNRNKELIRYIEKCGHRIGLHYRQAENNSGITVQSKMIEAEIGVRVDRFSIHRPDSKTAYENIYIPGMINTYSSDFFTRTDKPETAKVKYISDSKHRWNYGHPDKKTMERWDKMQILIHPFSWGKEKRELKEVFLDLMGEADEERIETFESEFQRFCEVKEAVKNERFKKVEV